jgi:hypothetical protein
LVKIQTIEELFLYILIFSFLLLPLAFLLNLQSAKKRIPVIIAIYGLLFFCLNYFFDSIPREYKKLYFTLYTFLEYAVFAFILWDSLSHRISKNIIIVSTILFGAFQVFYFFTSSLKMLDTIPIGIETILIFIFIFLFFYQNLMRNVSKYIYHDHCFWISFGLLIYLGGTFFFNILANHVANIKEYWYLTYIAELIKNIFFFIAIFILSHYSKKNELKNSNPIPYLDMV